MYKRLCFLIPFVLVLSLASTSYSQVVIGNWEDSNDGWVIDPCAPSGTTTAYSTTGVTLGTKSLKVNVPEPNWQAAIYIPLKSEGLDDEFFDNDFFSVDVTRLVEEWTPNDDPNFNAGIHLIVNANSVPYGNVWFDLGGRVFWNPGDGNNPRRAGWDYSATKAAINEASVSYLQLILATNYDPNFTTGGIYYLDNAKLSTYTGVIGNFENDMDGWSVVDDVNVSVAYEDTEGVTLGSKSLKIDAASGWHQAISYSLVDQGLVDEFGNNLKISADVTRLTSEWTEGEGAYCDFLLVVQAGSSADPNWDLWYQPPEGGGWLPANGDAPMSFTYDYSLALNQINFDNLEYLNLIFLTNWGGFSSGGIYYLDNVQMLGGGLAYAPEPSDGAVQVKPDITLGWSPGAYADKHDVYFGTNFDDVNDANRAEHSGVLYYSENQDANTYDPPGFLESATTYYWRIDEVNEAGPDPYLWKGDVWSFTTPYPGAFVIGDWEQQMDGWEAGPQGTATFDYNDTIGVTLNNYSLTMNSSVGYWTFQREGLVDLTNMTLFLDVTMIADEWSGQWTKVDKAAVGSDLDPDWREFTPTAIDRNTGEETTLDWGDWSGDAYKTYSWDFSSYSDWADATRITIHIAVQNNGDTGPFHFDNARLVDTRLASNPSPADYAEGVFIEPTLSWEPGKYAATHDVYFGTDFDDVNDANSSDPCCPTCVYRGNQDPCTYAPGTLEFDTIYYWRIDEVNEPNIWKGPVWTFMTGHYLVVDDFEEYNNTSNKIQDTWIKGGGGTVGYPDPNYAEVTIVHEGAQSMPFDYNNTASPYYSEATCTFALPQDWTTYGPYSLKSLRLWFRGYPASVGSFVESPPGTYTITASGTDIWDVPDLRNPSSFHDEFHYACKEVTAADAGNLVTIVAKVESVSETDPWAKAGVMIRDSLDPNSTHGLMCCHSNGTDSFQWRLETGGVTDTNDANNIGLPCWVKLVLDATYGNLRAYRSPTGADGSWVRSGYTENIPTMVLPRPTPLYVGLAVSAHNAEATCTAILSNVNITAGAVGAWKHQDIGIISNTASPLYVTLEDSTLNTATVTHDDPNAALTPTWTEWRIDMDDFMGMMNLDNVQKMYIGIGDPCEGGSGTMYFDDIRLYTAECILSERSAGFANADYAPEGDPAGDCVVDYQEIEVMGRDWLTTPPPNPDVDLHVDGEIDFKDLAVLAEFWLETQFWPPW